MSGFLISGIYCRLFGMVDMCTFLIPTDVQRRSPDAGLGGHGDGHLDRREDQLLHHRTRAASYAPRL